MWRGGRTTSARVRVALHRPVERHSSRDRAWGRKPVGAGEAGEIRCEIRSRPNKFGRSVDAPKNQLDGEGATGAANSHLAGLLMFS